MKKYISIILLFALAACQKFGDEPKPAQRHDGELVKAGETTLQSGWTVMSSENGGLAPLSFKGTIADEIIGCVYRSGCEYPDLYFQTPWVSSGLSYGNAYGINRAVFEKTAADGSLVYGSIEHIETAGTPLEGCYVNGGNSPLMRLVQIGEKCFCIWLKQTASGGAMENRLRTYEFDPVAKTISDVNVGVKFTGPQFLAAGIDVIPLNATSFRLVMLTNDSQEGFKPDFEDPDESFYDGAGIYRGRMTYSFAFEQTFTYNEGYSAISAGAMASIDGGNALTISPTGITEFQNGNVRGEVVINKLGSLKYLDMSSHNVRYMVDNAGNDLVNPSISGGVLAIKDSKGKACTGFITSCEGYKYWFKYTGKTDAKGVPVFEAGKPILQENGQLNAGSLCVPTVIDWDGDGLHDIVVGNSEGRLLFYKNRGTNENPSFGLPEYLKSAGEEICIRSGYYEVQGIYEAAWGYLCPTVFDWNGDGLPDVVFSSNEGKYEVMLNVGTKTAPKLAARKSLTVDGLEVYGEWRVRPAAARVGDVTYLCTLDGHSRFHLYRKVSTYGVEDCGALKLVGGSYITSDADRSKFPDHHLGYTGRTKIELVDWDGDGDLDLLLGANKTCSIPNGFSGLPWSLANSQPNTQCMWLENVGDNENMSFKSPMLITFNGSHMHFGIHSTCATACPLGPLQNGLPNLLIGCESGRMYYMNRSDITYYNYWQ